MNPAGRHGFWTAPRSVQPVLRAQPMLAGGRHIGLSGPFMGATIQAGGLDWLTVAAIQNRVVASPLVQRFISERAQLSERGRFRGGSHLEAPWDTILSYGPSSVPQLTEHERNAILALAADPTDEVLDDLAIIDGFFSTVPVHGYGRPEPALTPGLCAVMNGEGPRGLARGQQRLSLAQAIGAWINYRPQGRGWGAREPNVSESEIEEVRANPFYCGKARSFPEHVVWTNNKADYSGWFGIDPNAPWGEIKTQVYNAITVMDVVASYPFPPPIDLDHAAPFWILSIAEIQEIVRTPAPVDPEVVRYWITMHVLANYAAWSDRIAKDQKKKAKKAKRKELIKIIAISIAGIAAALLLPAVIALVVSAIKTAVTTYVDAQKRKEAAKDMANASKMFEADAAGFSKEIDRAAKLLDEQAAEQQASEPPSPELQAAIQEVRDETGPAWGTILPVGGGIAAAGLAAFLIFK